jgi:hypothetical protein
MLKHPGQDAKKRPSKKLPKGPRPEKAEQKKKDRKFTQLSVEEVKARHAGLIPGPRALSKAVPSIEEIMSRGHLYCSNGKKLNLLEVVAGISAMPTSRVLLGVEADFMPASDGILAYPEHYYAQECQPLLDVYEYLRRKYSPFKFSWVMHDYELCESESAKTQLVHKYFNVRDKDFIRLLYTLLSVYVDIHPKTEEGKLSLADTKTKMRFDALASAPCVALTMLRMCLMLRVPAPRIPAMVTYMNECVKFWRTNTVDYCVSRLTCSKDHMANWRKAWGRELNRPGVQAQIDAIVHDDPRVQEELRRAWKYETIGMIASERAKKMDARGRWNQKSRYVAARRPGMQALDMSDFGAESPTCEVKRFHVGEESQFLTEVWYTVKSGKRVLESVPDEPLTSRVISDTFDVKCESCNKTGTVSSLQFVEMDCACNECLTCERRVTMQAGCEVATVALEEEYLLVPKVSSVDLSNRLKAMWPNTFPGYHQRFWQILQAYQSFGPVEELLASLERDVCDYKFVTSPEAKVYGGDACVPENEAQGGFTDYFFAPTEAEKAALLADNTPVDLLSGAGLSAHAIRLLFGVFKGLVGQTATGALTIVLAGAEIHAGFAGPPEVQQAYHDFYVGMGRPEEEYQKSKESYERVVATGKVEPGGINVPMVGAGLLSPIYEELNAETSALVLAKHLWDGGKKFWTGDSLSETVLCCAHNLYWVWASLQTILGKPRPMCERMFFHALRNYGLFARPYIGKASHTVATLTGAVYAAYENRAVIGAFGKQLMCMVNGAGVSTSGILHAVFGSVWESMADYLDNLDVDGRKLLQARALNAVALVLCVAGQNWKQFLLTGMQTIGLWMDLSSVPSWVGGLFESQERVVFKPKRDLYKPIDDGDHTLVVPGPDWNFTSNPVIVPQTVFNENHMSVDRVMSRVALQEMRFVVFEDEAQSWTDFFANKGFIRIFGHALGVGQFLTDEATIVNIRTLITAMAFWKMSTDFAMRGMEIVKRLVSAVLLVTHYWDPFDEEVTAAVAVARHLNLTMHDFPEITSVVIARQALELGKDVESVLAHTSTPSQRILPPQLFSTLSRTYAEFREKLEQATKLAKRNGIRRRPVSTLFFGKAGAGKSVSIENIQRYLNKYVYGDEFEAHYSFPYPADPNGWFDLMGPWVRFHTIMEFLTVENADVRLAMAMHFLASQDWNEYNTPTADIKGKNNQPFTAEWTFMATNLENCTRQLLQTTAPANIGRRIDFFVKVLKKSLDWKEQLFLVCGRYATQYAKQQNWGPNRTRHCQAFTLFTKDKTIFEEEPSWYVVNGLELLAMEILARNEVDEEFKRLIAKPSQVDDVVNALRELIGGETTTEVLVGEDSELFGSDTETEAEGYQNVDWAALSAKWEVDVPTWDSAIARLGTYTKTILGVLACAGVVVAWKWWTTPTNAAESDPRSEYETHAKVWKHQGTRRKGKKKNEAQGSDANFDAVVRKDCSARATVLLHIEGKDPRVTIGTFLAPRVLRVPGHDLREGETIIGVRVHDRVYGTNQDKVFKPAFISVREDKDSGFIVFGREMCPRPTIFGRLREKVVPTDLVNHEVAMVSYDPENDMPIPHVCRVIAARDVSYADAYGTVQRPEGMATYTMKTKKGDCANPVYDLETNTIVGFHTAGNKVNLGHCVVVDRTIVREWLHDIKEDMEENGLEFLDTVAESQSMLDFPTTSAPFKLFNLRGDEVVPREKATTVSARHKLEPTPWHNKFGPVEFAPVQLGVCEYGDPLEAGLAKMKQVDPELPETPFLAEVMDEFLVEYPPQPGVGKLTIDEAVLGSREGLKPMNKYTSKGYPLNKGGPTRKVDEMDYDVETGEVWLSERVRQLVLKREELNKAGIRAEAVWSVTKKVEMKKMKLYDVNGYEELCPALPRLFCAGAMDYTIHIRRLFGDFIGYVQSNYTHHSIAIGTNVHGLDWGVLFDWLTHYVKYGVAGDFKNFDNTIPAWLLMRVLDIVNRWYGQRDSVERTAAFLEIIFPVLIIKDKLVRIIGEPSGNALTALLNSIVNYIVMTVALRIMCKKAQVEYESRKKRLVLYGDDNLLTYPAHLPWAELTDIIKHFFGMDYTPPWKYGPIEVQMVSDMTFLSRSFVGRPDGSMDAPMDMGRIFGTLYYMRSQIYGDVQNTLNNICLELSHHGREVFETTIKAIREDPYTQLREFTFPGWEEIKQRRRGAAPWY